MRLACRRALGPAGHRLVGVGVDDRDAGPLPRKFGCEDDGGGGLSSAALGAGEDDGRHADETADDLLTNNKRADHRQEADQRITDCRQTVHGLLATPPRLDLHEPQNDVAVVLARPPQGCEAVDNSHFQSDQAFALGARRRSVWLASPYREKAKIRRSLGEKGKIWRGKTWGGPDGAPTRPPIGRRGSYKPRLEPRWSPDFAPLSYLDEILR